MCAICIAGMGECYTDGGDAWVTSHRSPPGWKFYVCRCAWTWTDITRQDSGNGHGAKAMSAAQTPLPLSLNLIRGTLSLAGGKAAAACTLPGMAPGFHPLPPLCPTPIRMNIQLARRVQTTKEMVSRGSASSADEASSAELCQDPSTSTASVWCSQLTCV